MSKEECVGEDSILREIVTILLIPVSARDMAIPTLPITHGRRICISLRNELDAL